MIKIKIGILGCGWLGLPLAKSLMEKNYAISGSTTSLEKLHVLENLDITPFKIIVNENNIDGNIYGFLKDVKLLIIDIPPKLRAANPEDFVAKMKLLIAVIENSEVEKLIFVSATSVFPDDAGDVDEISIPKPDSVAGIQLLEVENLLQKNKAFKTTIVRFGGLIGTDRNPATVLSGKTNISNPEAPVNLIDQRDCIKIIEAIIDRDIFPKLIHAVAPFHPSKSDYYTAECNKMNMPPPAFKFAPTNANKLVRTKVLAEIRYEFLAPKLK